MLRGSKWIDIEHNPSHKGFGVYRIRLANSKGSQIEIPRFLDKDKDGILLIGRSKDLEKRIKCFRGAMKGKRCAHSEGQRLRLIIESTNFNRNYRYKIQYSFRRLQNEGQIQKAEERLLKGYFRKYGEPPPLNNNLPNKDKRKRKR
ncbi:MAG: hypothetical protein AMJ73_10290 [candidate division Zixibacteria bacterium SM1_73]|nr:MAG: hypothetical protein AMJ73_10290 [candidate division Zixibacteria bacterium SM1_73]